MVNENEKLYQNSKIAVNGILNVILKVKIPIIDILRRSYFSN